MGKKPFALRINEDLFDVIRQTADSDLRSVNAEIEVLLREALKARGRLPKRSKDTIESDT